jgi:D-alanine-D-alanine ligase
MCPKVAIVYNQPEPGRYADMGESAAIAGVLDEVEAVEQALSDLKYSGFRVPLSPPLERVRENLAAIKADVVFNLFEGFDGQPMTEVNVAEMLAELGLPYTGCNANAIRLCLDKVKAKDTISAGGITSPHYHILKSKLPVQFDLRFPCIVKPRAEDASHGITEESVVYDRKQLEKQAAKVCKLFGGEALVEEYIDGRELNATVIGNDKASVLPVSEIVYTLPQGKPRILTFAAKWEPQSEYYRGSVHVCPADVGNDVKQRAADIALSAFRLCGCSGYARVDFRQDAYGNLTVIDINPNPDISLSSGAARQARTAGLSYSQFIERIINIALEGTLDRN